MTRERTTQRTRIARKTNTIAVCAVCGHPFEQFYPGMHVCESCDFFMVEEDISGIEVDDPATHYDNYSEYIPVAISGEF